MPDCKFSFWHIEVSVWYGLILVYLCPSLLEQQIKLLLTSLCTFLCYWLMVIYHFQSICHLTSVKPRLHVQCFLAMAMQFQAIIALPSRGKNCTCSMSCAGNATSSEKLPKYCKLLIFWQFICQQILPSHHVAGLEFFRAMATQ